MEQIQQTENIDRFKTMMQGDEEIITLRTNVRKAAESKLVHGIIDVNSLLREINNENAAKTQQAIHEIDMLKEMYALKYTNNE
jgi:outer membrane efflux protein